jgi:hypothetical protein
MVAAVLMINSEALITSKVIETTMTIRTCSGTLLVSAREAIREALGLCVSSAMEGKEAAGVGIEMPPSPRIAAGVTDKRLCAFLGSFVGHLCRAWRRRRHGPALQHRRSYSYVVVAPRLCEEPCKPSARC